MRKRRPRILALLFAIAAVAGLPLMMAPASYASEPLRPSVTGPADPVCARADPASGAGVRLDAERYQPGNPAGLCVRTTGSKDNAAVWA